MGPVGLGAMARRANIATAVGAAVAAAAMVATPLMPRSGTGRRVLSSAVVGGLFVTTASRSVRRWGLPRALAAAGSVAVATTVVERIGVRTGLPFGRYHYTDRLQPQVGGVPIIVPMAWFAMAVPARDVAGGRSPMARVALASAALTAWDAFLDPQMTAEGYWIWEDGGHYRGIPLQNFAGWFLTGIGVMTMLEAVLPVRSNGGESGRSDLVFAGTYGFMAVMETIGFAAFFRDRLVAVIGGAAMLPFAAAGLMRIGRSIAPGTSP